MKGHRLYGPWRNAGIKTTDKGTTDHWIKRREIPKSRTTLRPGADDGIMRPGLADSLSVFTRCVRGLVALRFDFQENSLPRESCNYAVRLLRRKRMVFAPNGRGNATAGTVVGLGTGAMVGRVSPLRAAMGSGPATGAHGLSRPSLRRRK
jgi:hypothetical protein